MRVGWTSEAVLCKMRRKRQISMEWEKDSLKKKKDMGGGEGRLTGDSRPQVHVSSPVLLQPPDGKGLGTLFFDGSQPSVGIRHHFRHATHAAARMINKRPVVLRPQFRVARDGQILDHLVRDALIMRGGEAGKQGERGGRGDQEGRFCGVMDDGASGIGGEEGVDDAGVGEFEAEKLGDVGSATEGEDGEDVGIGETADPGGRLR